MPTEVLTKDEIDEEAGSALSVLVDGKVFAKGEIYRNRR